MYAATNLATDDRAQRAVAADGVLLGDALGARAVIWIERGLLKHGERVVAVARELLAMGCYEVSLGDTIGTGTAGKTLKESGLTRERLMAALSGAFGALAGQEARLRADRSASTRAQAQSDKRTV